MFMVFLLLIVSATSEYVSRNRVTISTDLKAFMNTNGNIWTVYSDNNTTRKCQVDSKIAIQNNTISFLRNYTVGESRMTMKLEGTIQQQFFLPGAMVLTRKENKPEVAKEADKKWVEVLEYSHPNNTCGVFSTWPLYEIKMGATSEVYVLNLLLYSPPSMGVAMFKVNYTVRLFAGSL
ncbi:uncharacterized protein LOC144103424 [Amblyomma americanum]